MAVDQTTTNSPVELFHELVDPAMRQLQTANLALAGWALQECERLCRAGRSHRTLRRMDATVDEGQRYLGTCLGGGFQTVGLGVSVSVTIKLKVLEGNMSLTEIEIEETEEWLHERYQGAGVVQVNGGFWIGWSDHLAKVDI